MPKAGTALSMAAKIAACAVLLSIILPAGAQVDPNTADVESIRSVIVQQIDAFKRDDAVGAYSFAAPGIQKIFHAAENDVVLLKKHHGFEFQNVFDTRLAAQILGPRAVALPSLPARLSAFRPTTSPHRSACATRSSGRWRAWAVGGWKPTPLPFDARAPMSMADRRPKTRRRARGGSFRFALAVFYRRSRGQRRVRFEAPGCWSRWKEPIRPGA